MVNYFYLYLFDIKWKTNNNYLIIWKIRTDFKNIFYKFNDCFNRNKYYYGKWYYYNSIVNTILNVLYCLSIEYSICSFWI